MHCGLMGSMERWTLHTLGGDEVAVMALDHEAVGTTPPEKEAFPLEKKGPQ